MTWVKGQKLIHIEFLSSMHLTSNGGEDYWLLGCLLLLASSFFWACWMILQVNYHISTFSFITFPSHYCYFYLYFSSHHLRTIFHKNQNNFGWFFSPSVGIWLNFNWTGTNCFMLSRPFIINLRDVSLLSSSFFVCF